MPTISGRQGFFTQEMPPAEEELPPPPPPPQEEEDNAPPPPFPEAAEADNELGSLVNQQQKEERRLPMPIPPFPDGPNEQPTQQTVSPQTAPFEIKQKLSFSQTSTLISSPLKTSFTELNTSTTTRSISDLQALLPPPPKDNLTAVRAPSLSISSSSQPTLPQNLSKVKPFPSINKSHTLSFFPNTTNDKPNLSPTIPTHSESPSFKLVVYGSEPKRTPHFSENFRPIVQTAIDANNRKLPPNWTEMCDATSGITSYYNIVTKETSEVFPVSVNTDSVLPVRKTSVSNNPTNISPVVGEYPRQNAPPLPVKNFDIPPPKLLNVVKTPLRTDVPPSIFVQNPRDIPPPTQPRTIPSNLTIQMGTNVNKPSIDIPPPITNVSSVRTSQLNIPPPKVALSDIPPPIKHKSLSPIDTKTTNMRDSNSPLSNSGPPIKEIVWKEALDPNSGKSYYFHLETNETTWEKPASYYPLINTANLMQGKQSSPHNLSTNSSDELGKNAKDKRKETSLNSSSSSSSHYQKSMSSKDLHSSSSGKSKSKNKAKELPADWRAAQDENGNTYYYNVKTRETSWKRPRNSESKKKTNSGSGTKNSSGSLNNPKEEWKEAIDPNTGKVYYYEVNTRQTLWSRTE